MQLVEGEDWGQDDALHKQFRKRADKDLLVSRMGKVQAPNLPKGAFRSLY